MTSKYLITEIMDYSKKENQIGCGYCAYEEDCKIKDPKINKAKQGCKEFLHWEDQSITCNCNITIKKP